MRRIIIQDEIFELFPSFNRGLVIVSDIENAPSNKRLKKPLNKLIEEIRGKNLIEDDFVQTWNEVHQKFGSNPNRYYPSIRALLKRIENSDGFPFINSVVGAFNYISLKYLLPCGADDLEKIEGNLCLGISDGNETFTPLGSEEKESPEKGEVIYFDDKTKNVMCRRWNWRNGDFTKITENTKNLVVNVDGIAPVTKERVLEARDELAQILESQCKANLRTALLNSDKREIEIDI